MSRELPFDPPTGTVPPDEPARIAEAVAKCPELREDGLERTTEQRTYTDVFANEHLGVRAISWLAGGHEPRRRRRARR